MKDLLPALCCWIVVGACLLLMGCRQDRPLHIIETNFDELVWWAEQPPRFLSNEQAHSSSYSMKMAEGSEFSPSMQLVLGNALPFVPKSMDVEAWAYFPNGRVRAASLVIETESGQPNGKKHWFGLDMTNQVKRFGTWVRVSGHYRFADEVTQYDKLKLYLWSQHGATQPYYIDDLKIVFRGRPGTQ
jgi:hypothetical protein